MRDRRPATEAEAAALASGIRLRIIRLTYAEALTNKEIAQRLGRDPATTLHHVRKLVDTGFLAPQPVRRGNRGAKEIPYLSTGKSWDLSGKDSEALAEAMLEAYLAEVAELDRGELDQSRLVIRVAPGERREFERRLAGLLDEFRNRSTPEGDEQFAVYVATYPSR
ncbi:helix-turn-helix domain-containing protein [Amycolatopsis thermalba]|uniref:Helix-turn-helix domain-containing protein n=1 Tax=Amycolatopsis thermalba TaxID=944492 RepID=A0ABY4P228_9PSEU|nr:helix-turn-helix domain-containing protein [Amycolatopsis thermalba]